MRFEKWQALGNDYLIVEAAALPFALTPERVRRLCDRHTGPGGDGVLELSAPGTDDDVVSRLRIFNPDGSEAELSGNGAREAILYLRHRGWTDADTFAVSTVAGEIRPTITGPDTCRVEMGRAALASAAFPAGPADGRGELEAGGRTWAFRHVAIGNPQCAIRVADPDELEALDLPALGPAFERARAVPAAHQRVLLACRGDPAASARGSSSAGWGRRCRRAPAPAARRSRTSCAAAPRR